MRIDVYSDGSATTKDKPGGWAYVLLVDGNFHSEGHGHVPNATNNDMELVAAIKGLQAALERSIHAGDFDLELEVTLLSDSQLILGWSNGTYQFKQADKMPLYEELRRLTRKLRVKTEWVKGHSGDRWNERCDFLANQARLGLQTEKLKEEIKATGQGTLIGRKKDSIASIWYDGQLFILDFSQKVIEAYSRELHGKRGSSLEIRKEKNR